MNTYPTLPTRYGSDEKIIREIQSDVASNGSVRARVMHTARRREFSLEHTFLTSSQRDTLVAFFDANLVTPFYYTRTRDAVVETYTVIFLAPPQLTYVKGARYHAKVSLREV